MLRIEIFREALFSCSWEPNGRGTLLFNKPPGLRLRPVTKVLCRLGLSTCFPLLGFLYRPHLEPSATNYTYKNTTNGCHVSLNCDFKIFAALPRRVHRGFAYLHSELRLRQNPQSESLASWIGRTGYRLVSWWPPPPCISICGAMIAVEFKPTCTAGW